MIWIAWSSFFRAFKEISIIVINYPPNFVSTHTKIANHFCEFRNIWLCVGNIFILLCTVRNMATQDERDMAVTYEPLARKFAPELYYKERYTRFRGITPSDFEGIYWTAVKSSVPWADVCIQYIIYFKEQQWVPGIFDRVFGKLPGNHPNDYAPIFIYFKNEKPVRTVFDICHYEAVGKIDDHSSLLFKDERPKFIVRGFFRGILPLGDDKGCKRLGGNLNFLNEELLTRWWKGITLEGVSGEKAELIIRKKLDNPFQEIKTFRNRSGVLGYLFDMIFKAENDKKSVPMGD